VPVIRSKRAVADADFAPVVASFFTPRKARKSTALVSYPPTISPDDLRAVEIPATSRRDATLHGVTAFELRHPAPSPPVRPADALTFPQC